MIFYRPHETWATRVHWRTSLPVGEEIVSIALSESCIVVWTSKAYVRVFRLFGVPFRVYRLKHTLFVVWRERVGGITSLAVKSLIEISSLQTQLAANLATQSAHIDNLVAVSMSTVENVQRGNKELTKARDKTSIGGSQFWRAGAFSGLVFICDWFI
ncbi:hypothetical protein L873DRAFT_1824310 [Choiromyces venosus 120613-1]|uniref:WDHD1/CFT4 second beta-propeller domain-containing protein n=1 Tax=Choiromyces venosus 120613-1 TaxID=1336337 RepID=A0A3N4IUY4_9PEZI|nr:hypothetical protein L873DRAFT_1824310 [Choiromyces venosus 120613-1]